MPSPTGSRNGTGHNTDDLNGGEAMRSQRCPTLGVSDLVVVRSGPVTLVAHKSRLDQIRTLVREVGGDHPDLI